MTEYTLSSVKLGVRPRISPIFPNSSGVSPSFWAVDKVASMKKDRVRAARADLRAKVASVSDE
jgi:hypothetical protein